MGFRDGVGCIYRTSFCAGEVSHLEVASAASADACVEYDLVCDDGRVGNMV